MRIERGFVNLLVDDLAAHRACLEALFEFDVAFESPWFRSVSISLQLSDQDVGEAVLARVKRAMRPMMRLFRSG